MRRTRRQNANASLSVTFGQIKSQTNVTFGSLIKFAWEEVGPHPLFPHRFFVHYHTEGSLLPPPWPIKSESPASFVTGRLCSPHWHHYFSALFGILKIWLWSDSGSIRTFLMVDEPLRKARVSTACLHFGSPTLTPSHSLLTGNKGDDRTLPTHASSVSAELTNS